jgi:hypothetical protein
MKSTGNKSTSMALGTFDAAGKESCLVRCKSQSAQYGEIEAVNDCEWRKSA